MLLTPTPDLLDGMVQLGDIKEPGSPLVAGVHALSADFERRSTGPLVNGAVVVANWSDGASLIIRGVIKGRNRVDLNLWPISRDMNQRGGWSGDGAALLRNALLYR